jgi:hypothetical protein
VFGYPHGEARAEKIDIKNVRMLDSFLISAYVGLISGLSKWTNLKNSYLCICGIDTSQSELDRCVSDSMETTGEILLIKTTAQRNLLIN